MCRANFAVLAFSAFLCASAAARDYYLSPAGDDANSGARRKPWRTIQKLNRLAFQPGDRILFAGGQTFAGTLELDGKDSGAPAHKLVVTSYGAGRATIDGGNSQAISIDGASHVAVRNLKLRGAGRKSGNTASGLVLARARDVEADHLEVSGFRSCGVAIDGVEGARVTHVHAHENGYAGICSQGAISRNLYVAYCLAENNPGSPAIRKNHSGNGIVVGKAQGAVIEYCEARYNGWDMPWTGNGPVGIWTYESDKVTIQFCVSHHNRSTGQDGGGFDFDGGVTNSVMQYNYSHSNYGAGYLICQYAGAGVFADNVVRYNISQDDGLKDHDAGIYVWVGGALMKSTLVHNNTIFNTKGSAVALAADKRLAGPAPVIAFHNNIFVSRGPQIRGADKGRFTGNLYWAMGERGFQVDDYKDFDAWVTVTGQEKHGGRVVGRFADPLLRKDGNGLLTDPATLATLIEYQLLRGSPAIDAGLDLRRLFGIDPGQRDFYGAPLAGAGNYDLGAHEFAVGR